MRDFFGLGDNDLASRLDEASTLIRKYFRPTFGPRLLRDIGVEDGDDYVLANDHLSEKTIANHLTLLGSMLRLATTFKIPWLVRLPKFNRPRIALFSHDYRYLRTDEEIRRLLAAALREGMHVFVLYALAIYTGMRAGEIAALQWSDVDFESRRITVQRSFDGPTKTDRVRYVPIFDALMPILKAWHEQHPGRLVFTSESGEMFGESAYIFQEVLHRVLKKAQFPETVMKSGATRRYIVFHSLRQRIQTPLWTPQIRFKRAQSKALTRPCAVGGGKLVMRSPENATSIGMARVQRSRE